MRLTHPDGGAVDVDPDHAGPYLSQGWQEDPHFQRLLDDVHALTAALGDEARMRVGSLVSARRRPRGNASRAAWAEYAQAKGLDVDGLTRNEIRDFFA